MTTYTRPGVYIEELPGPQAITQASTSNTAFIGRTETAPAISSGPTLITSWNAYTATFGSLGWGMQLPTAVYAFFKQGGSICYIHPMTAEGEIKGTAALDDITVNAVSPGDWSNDLYLLLVNSPAESPPSATAKPIFQIQVLCPTTVGAAGATMNQQLMAQYAISNKLETATYNGTAFYVLESFLGLSANDLTKAAATDTAPIEANINANSMFIRVSVPVNAAPTRPGNVIAPVQMGSGTGNSSQTPLNYDDGLNALNTLDNISLLVAPEVPMIDDYGTQREVSENILTYCENRTPVRDLFAILDMPYNLDTQNAQYYKQGAAFEQGATQFDAGQALHSDYGAIYYPWVEFLNPASNRNMMVPPSGMMAGTYGNADAAVGPWQSPAGTTFGALNIATGVSQIVTANDQSVLNPAGVNAIRMMTGYGILSYGARTLTTDPSLVYIAVRRTLIDIEVSLYNSLQWVVFEPNTPLLWSTVSRDVTNFLTEMWQAGALVGASAKQAFWVQCDASNNPTQTQREGQLIVDIGVAPSYPAEFVIIRLQQTTVGSS